MTETLETPLTDAPTSGVRDSLGTVQDIDEGKREVLVDIPWEVIDSYNSDFERSCFDEYLEQRLPVMCWAHNKQEPIGRAVSREKGARANQFVARFSELDAVPRARQAFTQIRDGDITDFSFYFDQAKAIPHPSTRGAIRFTKARMPEISPVVVGSIPGAIVTGVRQAADLSGVAELVRSGTITEAEGRVMLGLAGDVPVIGQPPQRERIVVGSGARSLTITIGDDGTVTTDGTSTDTTTTADTDTDPSEALSALDGALDAAIAYFEQTDLSSLPPAIGMAYQLVQAADVACDELMDAAGLPDYDEGSDDGDRATLSTAALNNKPDDEFAYIEPGGTKDGSGKTVPRDKRHFYIGDAAHVRDALGRIGQGAKFGEEAMPAVKVAAKKFGITVGDDQSKRSAVDVDTETQVALARMSLGRR